MSHDRGLYDRGIFLGTWFIFLLLVATIITITIVVSSIDKTLEASHALLQNIDVYLALLANVTEI
uniref:Uncharacterized protein n=1 Tax=Marseillevirus LCMAC103 TaxID=2506604 RepID=A0A481YUS8_9VIRU|nr:MAG: hypothetical protein LCMAC103_02780 [Marseillevirus LCMAC103]